MATSDIPQIDLAAELSRLAHEREETNKFSEETRKFTAETHKLMREAEKFRAEEWKLWREWRLAPWVFAIGAVGAIIGGLIVKHL